MSRAFQIFSVLVVTLCCISALAGCGSESSVVDQPDGGLHEFHLDSGASCEDCHRGTTSNGASIADPDLHVNAIREVDFSAAGFS